MIRISRGTYKLRYIRKFAISTSVLNEFIRFFFSLFWSVISQKNPIQPICMIFSLLIKHALLALLVFKFLFDDVSSDFRCWRFCRFLRVIMYKHLLQNLSRQKLAICRDCRRNNLPYRNVKRCNQFWLHVITKYWQHATFQTRGQS